MPSRPAPFRGQRYKRLKRRCLKRRSVFEDPEFPATDESLFYRRDPPDGVSWKRPGELCSDPRLFVDGISPRDLHQGSLGNCWFVAAASCLASEPSVWKKVIPNPREQDWDPCQPQRYCGIFRFCFWRWGHWTEVCVDDRLPCHQGKLLFCRSADPREFWSALLEKAYAKLSGCYEALEGGNTAEALLDFTGGISEPLTLDEGGFGTDPELQKQLFKQLKEAHSRSALISCSIRSLPGEGPEAQLSSGLVRGHAYGITAVRTVHLRRHNLFELFKVKKLQLIRLRNPWGTMEWNGAWSDKSPEWQQVSQRNRQQMGVIIRDDGEFWMSFEDFCTHFTDVVICRRMNTSRLSCQRSWVEGLQFGEWDPQKGRAGGCLNHRDTFLDNPQFFFEVSGAQDSVLISLQQQDTRQLRRSGSGGHNIPMGFELFSVEQNRSWRLHRIPPRVAGSTYIDSRSVLLRAKVPSGRYALLPTTFAPGQSGAFLLRIYSEHPTHLRAIDCNEPPAPHCSCCSGSYQLVSSVWVHRAVGLVLPNSKKPPDVYVKVCSEGQEVQSCVHKATSNPDFNFKAIFCRRCPHKPICIEVCARRFLRSTRLGFVKVSADTPTEEGQGQVLQLQGGPQDCPPGSVLVETSTSSDFLAL
ncbi:calpain-5-like isoform X2 [Rhineura floridana]|uniref:calpain-5-like isoform X2 n=1 Tax=Rhineura floridana TaxID=261503 RepID=UPI002AC84EA2|nr:calpain-5-like isoform X2 [Rhineura floridana]